MTCEWHLVASTVLATSLVPLIGYGRAAAIARYALTEGIDLRAAIAALSPATLDVFDALSAPMEK